MSAPEPYSAEELATLRTGSSYQTRANARWFATLAAAARARDAEVRELVEALNHLVEWGPLAESLDVAEFRVDVANARAVLAKHPVKP